MRALLTLSIVALLAEGQARAHCGFAEPPPPNDDPSCCDSGCCDEQPVPSYYYGDQEPHDQPPVAIAPYLPRINWAVGVRASSLDRDNGRAEGYGALIRAGIRRWELELDVGKDMYEGDRSATRVGASVYRTLTGGRLAPYLVVGAGVNLVREPSLPGWEEGFVAGGGGLKLGITHNLQVAGDFRWMLYDRLSSPASTTQALGAPVVQPDDSGADSATEARLAAILVF